MNLQDKTAHLQEAAMTEARLQGNAIIEQHKKALVGVFEQHKLEVIRQSETRVKAETTSVKQQLNMATSKAQLELKRELGRTQNELKKELFVEVRELVQQYMQTEDYKKLLVEYIEKAAKYADGAEMTIYINPSDADKKEYSKDNDLKSLSVENRNHLRHQWSGYLLKRENRI